MASTGATSTPPATSATISTRFAKIAIGIGTVLLAVSVLGLYAGLLQVGGVGLIVVGAIASSFAAESPPRE